MSDRLRLRVKGAMSVHEIYNRDKGRFAARYCKRKLAKARRRVVKQSLQQGFDGEAPPLHPHY